VYFGLNDFLTLLIVIDLYECLKNGLRVKIRNTILLFLDFYMSKITSFFIILDIDNTDEGSLNFTDVFFILIFLNK